MAEPHARPVDRLVGGYLLVTAAALLFPGRPGAWPLLLLARIALAAVLLGGALERARRWSAAADDPTAAISRRAVRILVDWYPLLFMPFLYWELPFLNSAIWDGRFFDGLVLEWEAAAFGSQPSASLAISWSSLLLSEILHLAYLSYYPILYFFPAALYLSGQREAFRQTLFAFMLGFTVCYVFFIAFPVQGPRYLFPPPGGPPADGWLYALTHTILESGSSRGAAFPSAHAALAAVATVQAARYLPRLAPLLALATLGISVGAVYGGFHYAVDMVAGLALGFPLALAAPRIRRALA